MKVYILDSIHPVMHDMLDKQGFECIDLKNTPISEIPNTLADATGIVVRSRMKLTTELIESCSNLKFIARVGAGLEAIDIDYAQSKGIVCLNSPEGNRDAVGEHAVGMLLALFRNINTADADVRNGIWERESYRGIELAGKTVGIIGYGNMGSAFAKRLQGFDVTVIAYDKYKEVNGFAVGVSLEELHEKADVISLHVPLTSETEYMVNAEFFSSLKNPVYLINTARGKVVNLEALIDAMELGIVAGACLDVLEYENFLLDGIQPGKAFNYLKNSNRVVLSPHVAGLTHESYFKLSKVLADKIIALNL